MINGKVKIIMTKRFKEHMEAHESQFTMPYQLLIKKLEFNKELMETKEDFIKIEENYSVSIGYNSVVKILPDEKIIYAKRKNRDLYSKFVVRDNKGEETNKVQFILKRNAHDKEAFNVITMFPGNTSEKEPEDKTIENIDELQKCLKFWEDKAFIYDESIVDIDTITTENPHLDLYYKVRTQFVIARAKNCSIC